MQASVSGNGHKQWFVPDMYLPESGHHSTPSHETICVMNTGIRDACITLDVLFEDDRAALKIENINMKAGRSLHLRMDYPHMLKGVQIPIGVPYSLCIQSTEKIIVEYSRLNWIDGEATTFAILAYFED